MTASLEPPWEELDASLHAFIGRRVRNPADVDDLVQRVLLQMVKGLGSLQDDERLHAWMYRTARNVIVDHYRSPAARRELASGSATDVEDAGITAADVVAGEDEHAALAELAACMTPMLDRLTPEHRDAIVLTELNGLNQAEAARQSGVSLSGMKSRVQRGRRQLRTVLEDCCRIDLDRRGSVVTFERRTRGACDPCGGDGCGGEN